MTNFIIIKLAWRVPLTGLRSPYPPFRQHGFKGPVYVLRHKSSTKRVEAGFLSGKFDVKAARSSRPHTDKIDAIFEKVEQDQHNYWLLRHRRGIDH